MLKRRLILTTALLIAAASLGQPASAQEKSIVVSSTTSTTDSGLFNHILPLFKKKTGIDVKVVSQGTGQALDTGRRGDSDVVFVHAKAQEEKFVADGFGVKRFPVMYNDFVLIGPKSDPAGIKGTKDIAAALNTASASNAYVLSDRATWINFKNRGELDIAVQGDDRLFNQYGVMLVNPEKHKHVKKAEGQAFIDWLISAEGQKAVADYKINGEQLFFPNATVPGA